MPPETGLYAGLGAIIGYAILGSSRQLLVGPNSTVAILSFSTVGAISTTDDPVDRPDVRWQGCRCRTCRPFPWAER
jgi:MFS superfamily sulfate permease-like transporter